MRPLFSVAQCLRFYSRLPIPPLAGEADPYAAPDFDAMPKALPFAGTIIGACGALALCIGVWLHFGTLVAAALATAAVTFITGAFHEDGLADTADGFGGGATVERRLTIMRDSLIGSFGGSALALAFIMRVACLATLTDRLPLVAAAACPIIAASLSRVSALYVLVSLPPAREDGMARAVGKTSWPNYLSGLVLAWLLTAALAVLAGMPPLATLLMPVTPLAVAVLMALFSRRMIGGQTGDVAGATQQIAEIAIYLTVLGASWQ